MSRSPVRPDEASILVENHRITLGALQRITMFTQLR